MKKYEEREYQTKCVNALYLDTINKYNPLIAVPTGAGKTVILSRFIIRYLDRYPHNKVLILSHTKNILQQDFDTLEDFLPDHFIGLYSSGLGIKNIEQITVAGIQSVYRKKTSKLFKDFDLCIIDEAHTISTKKKSMYQQFFSRSDYQIAGLTATPFRTRYGYIYEGEKAIFNKLSYDLTSRNKFNELIENKYLCKPCPLPPELQLNTENVKVTAGDYNLKDLDFKINREEITKEAIKSLIIYGKHYKSWLIFAINIEHAHNINMELRKNGINSQEYHSNNDNDKIIEEFKSGKIQAIINVGKLTTGFDAPNIDLICLLRPTMSPVLHVQMIGRGLRTFPGKTYCLVLDYAGNTARLGPINAMDIQRKRRGKNKGKAITKSCPLCGCLYHPTVKKCSLCGHEFVFKEKIKPKADNIRLIKKGSKYKWYNVTNVFYKIHKKKNRPDTLKVTYYCGIFSITEYICFDHKGYARKQALKWLFTRLMQDLNNPIDTPLKGANRKVTTQTVYDTAKYLKIPKKIYIDASEKYPKIKHIQF
jgi:DNA repair protein RadD